MNDAVLALDAQKMSIAVRDPLVVRADLIVRTGTHLGAIVDGVMFDLGSLNESLILAVTDQSHLNIHADHFDGGTVCRRVPIVHH